MSYQAAVVPSGSVAFAQDVPYTGDALTAGIMLSAIQSVCSSAGWTSSGSKLTSVGTPGMNTKVSITLRVDTFNNVFIRPEIGGVAGPEFNCFLPPFYSLYYLWANKYGFYTRANVSDPVSLSFFRINALYVPTELQGTAVTGDMSFYLTRNSLAVFTVPRACGTCVNGVVTQDPWGSTSGDFAPISHPMIYAGQGDVLTSNGRPVQQIPYVCLSNANNTEGKIGGLLCDSFISLTHSPDRSLATGPDGRTYYMWCGTDGTPGTVTHENLWLARS